MPEREMPPMGPMYVAMERHLELGPEVYNALAESIRGALAVTAQVRSIIPPFYHARLEACLEKAREAVSKIQAVAVPVGEDDR